MSRSKWKGPYIHGLKQDNNLKVKKPLTKIPRNIEIVPNFVGKNFYVHNGKNLLEVNVTEEMIGHKFGEFVFTRAKFSFKKKKTKK
jgi:ribosomal protein S19